MYLQLYPFFVVVVIVVFKISLKMVNYLCSLLQAVFHNHFVIIVELLLGTRIYT